MREDDCIFVRKVSWLFEKPLSDLVVVAASDEAVANEFEFDGTVFAVGGQSLELGDEVDDIFAGLLRTTMKFGSCVNDRLALTKAHDQPRNAVVV